VEQGTILPVSLFRVWFYIKSVNFIINASVSFEHHPTVVNLALRLDRLIRTSVAQNVLENYVTCVTIF